MEPMNPYAAAIATSVAPLWRSFSSLPAAEAKFVMEHCSCHEPPRSMVTCAPGKTNFAVVGSDALDIFHWSIYSVAGLRLDGGWEGSLADAKQVAEETQHLWGHRCELRERCRCAAHTRSQKF